MLDITFKQTEDELYELKAQFGKDVDPDALLASIASLLEMVKKAFPSTHQVIPASTKLGKKGRTLDNTGDVDSIIANMLGANKALLVSLFEYEQEHGQPVEEVRDIIEYAQKFQAYADLMKGKELKQEVQALRYQIRLLRDKGLLRNPPDRSLAVIGIEIAKRLKPELKVVEGFSVAGDDKSEIQEQIPNSDTVQESSQELAVQSLDGRLRFEQP